MAFDAGSLLSFLKLDTKGFSTGLSTAKGKVNQFDSSVGKSDKTLKSMSGTAAGLGKLMLTGLGFFAAFKAVTAFTGAIGDSIGMAADLEKGMANVATLVDTTVVSMDGLTDSVLEMTSEVLKSADDLSVGLYQVFSAGVTDSAEAMEVLRVSAIAATAGLSTTLTSVDAITTVINAYGLAVEDATDVSDLLFQTVKSGKVTFEQLAQALGTVVSTAASVGIELDDLFVSLATLTKGGINVRAATVGIRAILLSILSPTEKAIKKAEQLKIEWTAQAVQAKGLIGFIEEIREKTQGNTTDVAALVPNVRALNSVLALTGKQFEELTGIQGDFKDRTGASQEAFSKQADTFNAKTVRMGLAIDRLQVAIGKFEIAFLLGPLEEFVDFLERILTISDRFELKQIRGELKGLSETIQILLKQRDQGGFFGPGEEEIKVLERRIKALSQEHQALQNRAITLINVLDNSAQSTKALKDATKEVEQEYRDLVLGTDILTAKTKEFSLTSKEAGEQLKSIFTEASANKETAIKLDEKQSELLDELILKSRELGKTELEIFDMTIAGTADKLGALLASDQELTDRQREGLMAIFALREDLRNQEELKAEEQAQKEIDRAKRVEDAKKRSLASFNRAFENAGLTQLQIVERNERRAIAKATEMGQQTAQITEFFEEKKTQIKEQQQQKQLQAAGTFATATGDLANNLNQLVIQSGKEGSKELFLIMKVAAIANAIVSTAVGITRALELGIPLGPPAAALVGAAGAAQVAVIASTALKEGGLVTKPTNALFGEAGPEAVIPIEQGVAPIIEDSVENVLDAEQRRPTVNVFVVDDKRDLVATITRVQAETGEEMVISVLNKRNARSSIGQNTIAGVL